MKGISTVLAIVLIVVITVAIIGLAYGWATGMFKLTTSASEEQVASVTERLGKSVDIVATTCDADSLEFTIKSTGSDDILGTELSAFVEGTKVTVNSTPTTTGFGGLGAGEVSDEYSIMNAYNDDVVLKIDAPAGAIEETVACPASAS